MHPHKLRVATAAAEVCEGCKFKSIEMHVNVEQIWLGLKAAQHKIVMEFLQANLSALVQQSKKVCASSWILQSRTGGGGVGKAEGSIQCGPQELGRHDSIVLVPDLLRPPRYTGDTFVAFLRAHKAS